jgi:hypothetical protein
LLLIITMMTNGYDGSMMNNLQTLKVWKAYFNDPQGGTLGLFNAIQVSTIHRITGLLNGALTRRTLDLSPGCPLPPS